MNPFQADFHVLGTGLAFLSSLFYALTVIGMKKESKQQGVKDVLWFFFFATRLLTPFPFVYGMGELWSVLPIVLVLGVFATGFSYLLFNLALKNIEAGTSSIIINLITPLVAILLAVWIVQEEVNAQMIVGGVVLVFSGVYLEMHDLKLQKSLAEYERRMKVK